MAPKKKGGAKKGKKKKAVDDGESKSSDFVPLVMQPDVEEWVTLDMKLLNWHYLDFRCRVKTTTHLFSIKNRLRARHGLVTDLRLCKERFDERNEMGDDMRTLEDYGIQGAAETDPEVVVQVFYDFKPVDSNDPLLLVMSSLRLDAAGAEAGEAGSGAGAGEGEES